MANSYDLEGQKVTAMPANINQAAKVTPVYEEMKGWDEDITGVRDYDDLPVAARDYIKRIEDFTGIEPVIVSVGPDRDETMLLKNPFDK